MKLFCYYCDSKQEVEKPSIAFLCENHRGGNRKQDGTETEEWWACLTCRNVITIPILQGRLIDMPFDVARSEKFKVGRAEHGPVFLRNPVEEIDMELIDAVNYAEEAIRQGYDKDTLETIISKLKAVDGMVRSLYASREDVGKL